MTGWPAEPVIYEVNTAVWLDELSGAAGRHLHLGEIAPEDWDSVTPPGVDALWLMGVWERSPAGLAVANSTPELQASWRHALPDLRADDVIGSPYCVRRYEVDAAFGGTDGLAAARAALAARGVRLLLDYVPNHVAPDHPWTETHPERFIRGGAGDLEADPAAWTKVGDHILARGRDPYFPPWPDVVQLDAFSPDLRAATTDTLTAIAEQCDGIRCDMAMLMTNDVFSRTWAGRSGPAPAAEFWPTVIAGLRTRQLRTVLLAETYWDLEWELQQQGFDFCYDKRLYDRMLAGDAAGIRAHLRADLSYQRRLMRFLENHDEPRVAARLRPDAERAAAVAIATLPGATLWHEGQFEGRRVRPPVFLRRRPNEPPDRQLSAWYRSLLGAIEARGVRRGQWRLVEVTGWPDNQTCQNLLAWTWSSGDDGDRHLVAINFSDAPAEGRIALGWPDLSSRQWRFVDLLQQIGFDRDGDELDDAGLFVAMEPREFYVLKVSADHPEQG
jgi:hypothetical protein